MEGVLSIVIATTAAAAASLLEQLFPKDAVFGDRISFFPNSLLQNLIITITITAMIKNKDLRNEAFPPAMQVAVVAAPSALDGENDRHTRARTLDARLLIAATILAIRVS